MSIKKDIEKVLSNYNTKDYVPNGKAWDIWSKKFFLKLDLQKQDSKFINRLRELIKKDNKLDEQSFKKHFPELNYSIEYIDPLNFNFITLSKKSIQRISFELSNIIELEYQKIELVLQYYYRQERWDFDNFTRCLRMVDKEYSNIFNEKLFKDEVNQLPEKYKKSILLLKEKIMKDLKKKGLLK